MLHAVRERLPGGVVGRIEGFVAHTAPNLVLGLHDLALLVAGVIGFWFPQVGAIVGAITTLSLLAEGSGHMSLFRWLMPKAASYDFVARRPPDARDGVHESPLGTIVFAAPLDAPSWKPMDVPWVRGQRPLRATLAAALVVTAFSTLRSLAEPWGPRTLEIYVIALLILAAGWGLGFLAHRRPGTGRDSGSAAAVQLELIRRFRDAPVPGVDVWFAFTGCAHAYQGGMDAFLQLHAKTLTDPVLVVALSDPGRMPLRAVVAEGQLFPQHHRPTGPALVERLRWAGVIVPPIDLAGATDARAALLRGYRAVGLCGGEGPIAPETASRAADVAETLGRWFGDDLARVAVNRPALEELARATMTPVPVPGLDDLPEPVPEQESAK